MDNSETYIKMCKQAKRYLPVQIPEVGDYWVFGRGGVVLSKPELVCEGESWESPLLRPWAAYCYDKDEYDALISDSFPVFRQDQLQEMSGYQWDDYYTKCLLLGSYLSGGIGTPERVGLLLVMREKFGEVWSGEDWEMSDPALPLDKFKAN